MVDPQSPRRFTVFGRERSDEHPYDSALDDWASGGLGGPDAPLVAANLRLDHRVCPAREAHFDQKMDSPRSPNELWNALEIYFQVYVRDRTYQDYTKPDLNERNLLYQGDLPGNRIHPFCRLATVLDLSGLDRVFQTILSRGERPFGRELLEVRTPQAWQEFLNLKLEPAWKARDRDAAEPFLSSLLESFGGHVRRVKKGEATSWDPTWVTTLDHVKPYLSWPDVEPHRWLELVGVSRHSVLGLAGEQAGRWLVVLSHTVQEAYWLAVPTMLESSRNGCHYPSPDASVPDCTEFLRAGHPMDLGEAPPEPGLHYEFVHPQIPPSGKHWYAAGRAFGRCERAVTGPLPKQRQLHRKRLGSCYDSSLVESWHQEAGL